MSSVRLTIEKNASISFMGRDIFGTISSHLVVVPIAFAYIRTRKEGHGGTKE